jgi:hypothetical protein
LDFVVPINELFDASVSFSRQAGERSMFVMRNLNPAHHPHGPKSFDDDDDDDDGMRSAVQLQQSSFVGKFY